MLGRYVVRRVLSGMCSLALAAALVGCGAYDVGETGASGGTDKGGTGRQMAAVNLMENVGENTYATDGANAAEPYVYTQLGLELLQKSLDEGSSTVISPLSVLEALTMAAIGSGGNTRKQFEAAFGTDVDGMAAYLYRYDSAFADDGRLKVANSVWYKNASDISIKEEYLARVKGLFAADAYKAPFDETTLADINGWVSDNTDGMIPGILEEISDEDAMYLLNAVAFDGEWAEQYGDANVHDGSFNAQDGTRQTATMMYSEESLYLSDEHATGFIKFYKGEDYAFVALLPEEGLDVVDYVRSLDGEHLGELLANPEYVDVHCTMPKFSATYDIELSGVLASMGITDAFSGDKADFSGMGTSADTDLYIGSVIHKAYMEVDEKGTKAGAATAIGMVKQTALIENYKTVYLDRPFLYMIVDCSQWQPVFMGTLMGVD
jgi:serpin B